MRRLLILAVLLASPAAAQTAGDRYGSGDGTGSRPQAPTSVAQRYSGRVLTWSGKVMAAPAASGPTSPRLANTAPQLRGAPQQAAGPAPFQPQAPSAAPASMRQAQAAPIAPTARVAPAPPTTPKALPTSLYGATSRGPVLAGGLPAHAGTEARLYSLHREYGLQPDAIPEPPAGQRYVLIGPPDHAAAPQDDPRPPAGGPADAPS